MDMASVSGAIDIIIMILSPAATFYAADIYIFHCLPSRLSNVDEMFNVVNSQYAQGFYA